jgi:hypothetical protein
VHTLAWDGRHGIGTKTKQCLVDSVISLKSWHSRRTHRRGYFPNEPTMASSCFQEYSRPGSKEIVYI